MSHRNGARRPAERTAEEKWHVHRRHLEGSGRTPHTGRELHRAFPDIHRELFRFYSTGNIVVVQLALQGTHLRPLHLAAGTLPATGKRIDAPCCDVFELVDGKIKRFDCYPEGSVILTQLGVIGNLAGALVQ